MNIQLNDYTYTYSDLDNGAMWKKEIKDSIDFETVFDIHCDFYAKMEFEVTNLGWYQDQDSKIIESKVFINNKPYVLKTSCTRTGLESYGDSIVSCNILVHLLIKKVV